MLLRPSFLLPCHKPACSCPSGSDFKLGLPIVVFTGSMVLGPWDSIIPSRIGLVTFSTVLTTKCTSIFVAATVGQRLEQQSHLRCRHVTVGFLRWWSVSGKQSYLVWLRYDDYLTAAWLTHVIHLISYTCRGTNHTYTCVTSKAFAHSYMSP